MPKIKGWKKVGKSYYDYRTNPFLRKVAIYRSEYKSHPTELIISYLTNEGVDMMKKYKVRNSGRFTVNKYTSSVSNNLGTFKTKQAALKFAINWMKKHPNG